MLLYQDPLLTFTCLGEVLAAGSWIAKVLNMTSGLLLSKRKYRRNFSEMNFQLSVRRIPPPKLPSVYNIHDW